jgi:hypothetical protein
MDVVAIARNRVSQLEEELAKLRKFLEIAKELTDMADAKPRPEQAAVKRPAAVETAEPKPAPRKEEPETGRSGYPFSDPLFQRILADHRSRHGLDGGQAATAPAPVEREKRLASM